jgi:hypothetical protein
MQRLLKKARSYMKKNVLNAMKMAVHQLMMMLAF